MFNSRKNPKPFDKDIEIFRLQKDFGKNSQNLKRKFLKNQLHTHHSSKKHSLIIFHPLDSVGLFLYIKTNATF